jgi:DNA ligase-1
MIKPLLAVDFNNNKGDVTQYVGWYMSEKLDGVRCLFRENTLYSRTGHIIQAPEWFVRAISSAVQGTGIIMLDGELYTRRNDFQKLCSIVRKKHPVDDEWRTITYMIFDIPLESDMVFHDRYLKMRTVFDNQQSQYLKLVEQKVISCVNDISYYLDDITTNQGEGIMLRDPASYYEQKRSKTLVKYKKFMDDDAIIIGVESGKGKYAKAIGKFKVQWVNQPHIQFHIGTGMDDILRETVDHNSLLGKIIKVKYYSVTDSGIPRFPVFIGFREDEVDTVS